MVAFRFCQLFDMGENGKAQQTKSFVVGLVDVAYIVQYDNAGIDAVHDQLVIFFFLGGICFGLEKDLCDAVK